MGQKLYNIEFGSDLLAVTPQAGSLDLMRI